MMFATVPLRDRETGGRSRLTRVLLLCVTALLAWPGHAAAFHEDPWQEPAYPNIFFATASLGGLQVHYNPWICIDTDGCSWNPNTGISRIYTTQDEKPQSWHPITYPHEILRGDWGDFEYLDVVISACYTGEKVNADCGHTPPDGWRFGARTAGLLDWVTAEKQGEIRAMHSTHTEAFAVCIDVGEDEAERVAELERIRTRAAAENLLSSSVTRLYGWGPMAPGDTIDTLDGRSWNRIGRNWSTDVFDPRIVAYAEDDADGANWMGGTLDVSLHPHRFQLDEYEEVWTDAATDADKCTRPTCGDADLDGDGDPANDPAPPFVFDPEDPWQENSPVDCVCREASKLNYRKFLEEGAVNWLGWQHVGWSYDWFLYVRVRDPDGENGWAQDTHGNPVCGRPH